MPNGTPDFTVLVEDFLDAYATTLGRPLTPQEQQTLSAALNRIYRRRFDFRQASFDWDLMRVQAATLGGIAAQMLDQERTNPKFWGTEGQTQPGAPVSPQQVDWAREVFGTQAQPPILQEVFDRLKERAEALDLPTDRADEACQLCTNNP